MGVRAILGVDIGGTNIKMALVSYEGTPLAPIDSWPKNISPV